MGTFITLIHDTDRSVQSIKETIERAESFKHMAMEMGVTVREIYWTQGQYDGVAILDAPDGESVSALMIKLSVSGNVRTQTFMAYTIEEMFEVVSKLT